MSWKTSLNAAVTALRKEERRLERELSAVRGGLESLSGVTRQKGGSGKSAGKRQMSAKGRAAISRAAKKRWAAYRADKRRKG